MQPYVPEYRVPFFKALSSRLSRDGHELVVLAGHPGGEQAERLDEAQVEGLQQELTTRTHRIGPVTWRSSDAAVHLRTADVAVVGLAAGSLETVQTLASRRIPVGVWGHVGDYVTKGSMAGRLVKRWQVRAAGAVFAYTDSGAAQAVRWGAKTRNIYTLNNTVDLSTLITAVDKASGEGIRRKARTFGYIGALDESKRIDLLVGALDLLWNRGVDVHVLIAGEGRQSNLLAPAEARGQVTLVGRAGDELKARMAVECTALLNPGRVGLIAPESFVLGLPIITTSGARHAPEFEYLRPGSDSLVVGATSGALADAMDDLMTNVDRAGQLQRAASARSGEPPLDHMVETFCAGVTSLIHPRTATRDDEG